MTGILALVFVNLVFLFLLSALLNDERTKTRRTLDDLAAQYDELADRDVSDRHWVAKKQLDLTAAAEMSRIADPG